MSRRKQAKPRAVLLKHEESGCGGVGEILEEEVAEEAFDKSRQNLMRTEEPSLEDDHSISDSAGGSVLSWNSEETGEEVSLSSCPTPTSEGNEPEVNWTVGPTENTPYSCQFCQKAFSRLSLLNKHEQSHSEEMPFQCDFCQRLFKHKRSRDRHVKLHTGDRKYRCTHCESAFSRSDHLKIHMKTHDHQKPYQCVICNRGYNTAAALTSHMQNHKKESQSSPNGALRCLQCTATFPTGEELQVHVSESHPPRTPSSPERQKKSPPPSISSPLLLPFPTLRCIYCTKDTFSNTHSLQLHIQAIHGPVLKGDMSPTLASTDPSDVEQELYTCVFCTIHLSSLQALQKHTATVHSLSNYLEAKAKENAFCATCAIAFPNAIAYAEHFILTHASKHLKPITIGDPPQMSPTDLSKKKSSSPPDSPDLSKRERKKKKTVIGSLTGLMESAFGTESLICNQCSAGFGDFESFRRHLQTHLAEVVRKFRCEECSEEFVSGEALETHALSHFLSSGIEYGCESCGKSYAKPDDLQKHLLDIHAHHLFRCSLCKEVFDSKVAIQVHFAVAHSNEAKVFRCKACATTATSERDFQAHVKVLHLRKVCPYRCLLCSSSFGTEIDLQLHLHTHQKPFTCNQCNQAFHVEFLLDKHMESEHGGVEVNGNSPSKDPQSTNSLKASKRKKDTKCDICDKGLGTEAELTAHRKEFHHLQPPPPFRHSSTTSKTSANKSSNGQPLPMLSLHCAYCQENCKSRTDLENHMKTHQSTATGRQKCNICDELCPTPTLLAEHKLTHCKVVSGSLCVGCKQTLSSEEEFYTHMKQHAVTTNNNNTQALLPLPCIVCRQTLISDIEIQIHGKFHTKRIHPSISPTHTITCCLCHRIEDKRTANHFLSISQSTVVCGDCARKQTIGSPTIPQLHRITPPAQTPEAGTQKTYQCIKCQRTFGSEEEIQSHVATHLIQEGSAHECHLCGHSFFDSPLKLQTHLIEHTFEGCSSFRCYICSTVFTTAAALHHHMLSHGLQARPYDCAECNLKFFFRAELENHKVSHAHLGQSDGERKLSSNGHVHCRANRKRKKFFYRSDDSDEEMELGGNEKSEKQSLTQNELIKMDQSERPSSTHVTNMEEPSSDQDSESS